MEAEARPPADDVRHLRALLDALDVGVMVADDAGVYVDVNRAACRILGRSREEVLGTTVQDLVDPGRQFDVAAQWSAFLRDGSQTGAFELQRPDGTPVSVAFQARADFVPGLHCSFLTPLAVATASEDSDGSGDYPVLCAWTKRVRMGDEWVPIEEYLLREHDLLVTHGLSPAAAEELERGGE